MNFRSRTPQGFTLIEVMAVVALISFVFFVALNFYTDLARATTRASDHTRGIRRASAILDRVARDVEGAVLVVKPPELDPFAFPWIFLGQTRLGGDVSDRLKFITRSHIPARTDAAESNLATVAYIVESAPDDSISLFRWISPRLPESLDKNFPTEDESMLLAEGLQSFGFSFYREDGTQLSEWDSSTLLESSSLPVAVEIQLSLIDDRVSEDAEPPIYRRKVLIPVRPLDLAALSDPNNPLSGSGEDGEDEEDDDEPSGEDGQCTNADAFPSSVPDSASSNEKICVGLANSAPDMIFTPDDYLSLPEECKPLVNPKCR